MKLTLVFTFLTTLSQLYSQEYAFKPNWEKGDHKEIQITRHELEYRNGKLTRDDISSETCQLTVLKNSKKSYKIKLIAQNPVIHLVSFDTSLRAHLESLETMELVYTIDKTNYSFELVNDKQVNEIATESVSKLLALVQEKTPHNFSVIDEMTKTWLHHITNLDFKGSYYLNSNIKFVLLPFQETLHLHETISTPDSITCPNFSKEKIPGTMHTSLASVEKNRAMITQNYDANTENLSKESTTVNNKPILYEEMSFGLDRSISYNPSGSWINYITQHLIWHTNDAFFGYVQLEEKTTVIIK